MRVVDEFADWVIAPSGLILAEDVARLRYDPPKHPQGGDIFAGCGGASLGFKSAGIQIRFAVEFEPHAALTYMVNLGSYPCSLHFETEQLEARFAKLLERGDSKALNRQGKDAKIQVPMTSGMSGVMESRCSVPGTDHMWVWDVSKLTGRMLLDPIGIEPGKLDFLHGSPPCQGFSTAGRQDPTDPRNSLMLEYARLITEIQPKTFTLEQVPNVLNMTTADGQPMIEAFVDCLDASGYSTRKALTKMMKMQGWDTAVLHPTKEEFQKTRRNYRKEQAAERAAEKVTAAKPLAPQRSITLPLVVPVDP